jgi:hypothetical protein
MHDFTHPVYAAVWLDGHQARIVVLHREDSGFDEHVVRAATHHDSDRHGAGHHQPSPWRDAFFEAVTEQLVRATHIWIVGPSGTRKELESHLKQRHSAVAARIRGNEPMDHPSDGQLAERARRFFAALEAPHQVFVRN